MRSIHVDFAEQGSKEQGNKDMDAFNAVMDKVKSHPEVVEKVKDEVKSLADALHLHRHHGKTSDLPLFLGLSLVVYQVALVNLFTDSLIVEHLHHPFLEQDPKIKNLRLKRTQRKASQRRASTKAPLPTRLKNLMCWSKQ